jgi:hypothetical protein
MLALRSSILVALVVVACGTDRADPAPIGMSAGSVTAVSGANSTTMPAGTDAPGPTGSDTGDSTGVGGTSGADSMPDSAPDSMPDSATDSLPSGDIDGGSTFGAGDCVEGEVCEVDGVCVLTVDASGVMLVCSHGEPGEPCASDGHCLSGLCLSKASRNGIVTSCA